MPTQTQNETSELSVPMSTARTAGSSRRLRVLHVVSTFGLGGTEHGVLKVIRELGNEEFEHEICAVRRVDEEFASRMNSGVRVSSVGTSKPGFQFPLFRLKAVMKRFQPDIVHSRNFGAIEAVPAARLAGAPVVIHSEHGYELEILKGLPLRRRLLCRAFFAMTDQVFTVSDELRNYHAKQAMLPLEKFAVIRNGVQTDRFRRQSEVGARMRRELGIPEGRTVVGSVGRLVPIKNYGTLLSAAEMLIRQGKDLQVLIVGSGPELESLRAMAENSSALNNRTKFIGSSDRIAEMLTAMDVFVLPSISEGMSNTILEAMASGLPLVVTKVGGNPELVIDGQTGFLFSPRDAAGLADRLRALVENARLREELGNAGRSRAIAEFDLAAMTRNYRELYQRLAKRRANWKEN